MDKVNLLRQLVNTACTGTPYAGLEATVEKEILHYDIMAALNGANLLDKLVFQGGTCLRMAYQSERLSEDLDFVGGREFSPPQYHDLAQVLENYFRPRYGLDIVVKKPKERVFRVGSTQVGRWTIVIETQPETKGALKQKIKIEIANVPSYSKTPKALVINYPNLQTGLSTILVNCETQEEIFADKVVALCLRKFIKARDLWDLVMLNQQRRALNTQWVMAKFNDYQCNEKPVNKLKLRQQELVTYWQSDDFVKEMSRFLTPTKREQTVDKDGFMTFFVDELNSCLNNAIAILQEQSEAAPFKL